MPEPEETQPWREITIAYAVRPGMDVDAVEWDMFDAALKVLGCTCTDDSPPDQVCGAGDWVASGRPLDEPEET